MMKSRSRSILVFGGGALQLSIIEECRNQGLYTVVIDPDPNARGKAIADAFEVVGGDDFAKTCAVVEQYKIDGIVTAATDKPLVMMGKVAQKYEFPFFSQETAEISTDKHLMKQAFREADIPCAQGHLAGEIDGSLRYPLMVKPRDNSGSRGVVFCRTREEAETGLANALACSKKDTVLVEEVIYGQEYSIEALHFQERTWVLQATQKLVTPHPFNVELGHIQPADLTQEQRLSIDSLISRIARALRFENCASHTEVKINEDGIFVIETSPRLGGDFITSRLTPLSTGINMEGELVRIALGQTPELGHPDDKASAIFYFDLFDKGQVPKDLSFLEGIKAGEDIVQFSFDLEPGADIPRIKHSLDRYGFMILSAESRQTLLGRAEEYMNEVKNGI